MAPASSSLLIEQLHAEDLDTRQAAAVALGRIGDRRATAPLVAALDDPRADAGRRGRARAHWRRCGLRRAGRRGWAILMPAVRQAVIAALNSIGHPGHAAAASPRCSTDADPIVRESALKIAGYFGYPDCLERVLACCRDDERDGAPHRRRAAAVLRGCAASSTRWPRALEDDAALGARRGGVGARRASSIRRESPRCCARSSDADPWVRFVDAAIARRDWRRRSGAAGPGDRRNGSRAARASGRHRGRSDGSARPRRSTCSSRSPRSPNATSRARPSRALGNVDRDEALAILEQHSRAPEPSSRLAAVDALAAPARDARAADPAVDGGRGSRRRRSSAAALDALARVGRRDDEQGSAAARALIALTAEPSRREAGDQRAERAAATAHGDVAAGLRHASTDVRCASVEALGRMKQPDASRALESGARRWRQPVRLTAVAELKHLGTHTSQRKLLAMARTDPDGEVRHAAMRAVAHARRTGVHSMEPR